MTGSKSRTERVEGVVLVAILLVVGGLAGAASFTHVHDWTMANSPAGTGDWFGWANAAISELIPLAALLTIRRRRRAGGSIGYPMFLLIAAVALSMSAQLAVAKPGLSGWLLSAVPALAFLGLSKLVLTTKPAPSPATPADSVSLITEDGDQDEQEETSDGPDGGHHRQDGDQAPGVDLVQLARRHAAEHRAATGQPITHDELGATLRVANTTASDLLGLVREPDRPALVPVTAGAFPIRNGTRPGPSASPEVSR